MTRNNTQSDEPAVFSVQQRAVDHLGKNLATRGLEEATVTTVTDPPGVRVEHAVATSSDAVSIDDKASEALLTILTAYHYVADVEQWTPPRCEVALSDPEGRVFSCHVESEWLPKPSPDDLEESDVQPLLERVEATVERGET